MNMSSSDDDGTLSPSVPDIFALTKSSNSVRVERPLITKTYFYVQGAGNSPSKYYERKCPHEFIVDVCLVMQWLEMLNYTLISLRGTII